MRVTPEAEEPRHFRQACREGSFTLATAGLAPGYLQANLMVVPGEAAAEFRQFCELNPKPCPIVEYLANGRFAPDCAPGADLRSDLPGYRIYCDGALVRECKDIRDIWRADLASFLIGCSFTFEHGLVRAGIRLRHLELGINVAMYNTNIPCTPVGRFQGNMVISMRPVARDALDRVIQISARYPNSHGAPVHVGDPAALGIADINQVDYGSSVAIADNEVPVFWACGVTPQAVALASRLPFCITHSPGKMFLTDLAES